MARPFEVNWQDEEATLFKLYKQETDHQKRSRLQALWLLRGGHSLQEVTDSLGVHYRTVQRWVGWYRQGGLSEALAHRHGARGGPVARLSHDQEAELVSKAREGELRSIRDGVGWAEEEHDIHYSYWGMRQVYERLGLKKKVPRPTSPKASHEAQAAWKRGA
jgi:transposase